MGTPATVIAKTSDGKYKYIHVSYDGYKEHLGFYLVNYYGQNAADWLINSGDASFIGMPYTNSSWNCATEWTGECTFFKDRGDLNIDAKIIQENTKIDTTGDYVYLWDGNKWYLLDEYSDTIQFYKLTQDDITVKLNCISLKELKEKLNCS